MTRETLERLSYICAHRVMQMESLESQAIPAKQFACAGKRRSVAVERIADVIAGVFEGCEAAELASMMQPSKHAKKAESR